MDEIAVQETVHKNLAPCMSLFIGGVVNSHLPSQFLTTILWYPLLSNCKASFYNMYLLRPVYVIKPLKWSSYAGSWLQTDIFFQYHCFEIHEKFYDRYYFQVFNQLIQNHYPIFVVYFSFGHT